MGRAPCCDKANVKKGPWAPEEDAKLKAYIEQHGTGGNWIALPQKIGLRRCGKSCRLRWLNYLRPNIKHGGFTEEEDNIICSLYISIGSRWSIIAARLPGRTDNDIKNYWNTRLKKKLLGRRKQNRISILDQDPKDHARNTRSGENSCNNLQNLSSSALERLQLHMQLQNPFSLYNNPALWPKMNPLMIQTLLNQDNQSNNLPFYQNTENSDQRSSSLVHGHQLDYSNLKIDNLIDNSVATGNFSSPESSFNAMNNIDQTTLVQESGFMNTNSGYTQAELDDLLYNRSSLVLFPSDQSDFDGFNGSQNMNLSRWINELDAASTSSSSNSGLNQSDQEISHQDYGLIGSYGM